MVKERFKSFMDISDELYDEETRLLRSMTVNESLILWLKMQAAFEWQLQQSAPWFEADHRNAMIELQARLRRLVE